MTGEVVVVTGCTKGGIGHALCEEFAGKGCKVYATARRVEAIGDFKDTQIVRLRLDVTSDADVADVVKTVLDREGRIDIVVNNAARPHSGPLAEVSLLEAKITFDTNIFGPLRLSQAAFPHMATKKSGRIVNIGSIMGDTPAPWGGVYGATKAALARISEILYMEAAPFNIHVMHISPGGVKTNIAMHALDQLDLPENSFYKPWLASMTRAIAHADGPLSLTAERFAQKVVSEVLKPNPPRYMTLGVGAWPSAMIQWLPRGVLCWLMWQLVAGEGLSFLYGLIMFLRRLLRLD